MTLPHKLRYSLARLKPLSQPIVWCPILVLTFLGAFVLGQIADRVELRESSTRRLNRNAPQTSAEQAEIPDIDSLDALFNELETPPQLPITLGDSSQTASESTSSTLLSLLQNSRAQAPGMPSVGDSEPLSQASNPFDTYLERYQFIGNRSIPEDESSAFFSQDSESNGANSFSASPSPPPLFTNNFLASSQAELSAQQPNQLGLALERRSLSNTSATLQPVQDQRQTTSEETSEEALANEAATSVNLLGQQIVEGNIPSSRLTFIRTLPDMSPPPGTTGYTPPQALDLSPATLSGGNAFTNLATPQAADGSSGPSLTSGQSGLTGNVGVPSSVLPPTTGTQLQPQIEGASFESEPFSVPREPGRYVGGGYINTFSNPGAGPDD